MGNGNVPLNRRCVLAQCGASALLALLAPLSIGAANAPLFDYPEHTVREFLKIHFAGLRTFNTAGIDKKDRLLTRRFRERIYKFFDKVRKSESSVPLVIDPFTGSQGATSYTVGNAKVRSEKAWVPANFSDGQSQWTITYLMRNDQENHDSSWRIDDIQDRRGMLLTDVMRK